MSRSIRARLATLLAVSLGVIVTAGSLFVYWAVRKNLQEQLEDSMLRGAIALSGLVEQEGAEIDSELGPTSKGAPAGELCAKLWTEQQRVLDRSDHGCAAAVAVAVDATERHWFSEVVLPDGTVGRQITLAFVPRQEPIAAELAAAETTEAGDEDEEGDDDAAAARGAAAASIAPPPPAAPAPARLYLGVARSTGELAATLARLRLILTVVSLVILAACTAAVWAVVRAGLSPLLRLANAIAGVRSENLTTRFHDGIETDELQPICQRLNELLERLAESFSRERQLTAEIAHELRTPLAGIKTTLEVALLRERKPQQYQDTITECLRVADATGRLVEAMLTLARLDGGAMTVPMAPVQLAPLVQPFISLHGPRAEARGLSFEVTVPPELTVVSNQELLSLIISNLIDNATAYAAEQTQIQIAGISDGRSVSLSFVNFGSQIRSQDAGLVFQRFWRGAAERSVGEHAGLGLAICQKAAERLGARISAACALGGAFTVTIEWPAVGGSAAG